MYAILFCALILSIIQVQLSGVWLDLSLKKYGMLTQLWTKAKKLWNFKDQSE